MRNDQRLFGRESEIEQLEAMLAGNGDEASRIALIEGAAGMGKTLLLEVAKEQAEAEGLAVLDAVGSELEQDFSFGVARQLLDAGGIEFDERVFESDGESPLPVVHGISRAIAAKATQNPLLITVDDAQWADLSSLRLLDYLVMRLDRIGVKLLVGNRPLVGIPGAAPDPTQVLLTRLRERPGSTLIRLRPLGLQASADLLSEEFTDRVDPEFASACQAAAGGNPFFLRELAAALATEGHAPERSQAGQVGEIGPESVARSAMRRAQVLGTEAEQVLVAVAVLDSQADSNRVASMTGLSPQRVSQLADQLANTELLVDGRPLRFQHPIVRRAIYDDLPTGLRAAQHASAAHALAAEGMPAVGVAPHLLATEPAGDAWAVEQLLVAAEAAFGEGSPERARDYLNRAISEPPVPLRRAAVLGRLGMAEAASGRDLERARELLEKAAALSGDSGQSISWVEEASQVRLFSGEVKAAVELLDHERSRLGQEDRELQVRLAAHAAGIAVLRPRAAEGALAALEEMSVIGDSPADLALLAELGAKNWLEGRINEAAAFARRALQGGVLLEAEGPRSISFNHAIAILIDADQIEFATEELARGTAAAHRQASLLGVVNLIPLRSVIAWRCGEVGKVLEETAVVVGLLEERGSPVVDPNILGYRALAAIESGDLDTAEAILTSLGNLEDLPELTYLITPYLASVRLLLARSQPEPALRILLDLEARQEAMGSSHMAVPWGYTAVEAALAAGQREEAVDIADRQLVMTERWNTPSARGISLAAAGLAAGGKEGAELMVQGIELLADSPVRLDLARAQIGLGSMLRRDGRRTEAREPLRSGLETADRCGSVVLTERARQELITAGARPRRRRFSGLDSLTESERRVLELAAEGMSNREIASKLVLSVRTVENHLTRSYRKLGIGSRSAIATALHS